MEQSCKIEDIIALFKKMEGKWPYIKDEFSNLVPVFDDLNVVNIAKIIINANSIELVDKCIDQGLFPATIAYVASKNINSEILCHVLNKYPKDMFFGAEFFDIIDKENLVNNECYPVISMFFDPNYEYFEYIYIRNSFIMLYLDRYYINLNAKTLKKWISNKCLSMEDICIYFELSGIIKKDYDTIINLHLDDIIDGNSVRTIMGKYMYTLVKSASHDKRISQRIVECLINKYTTIEDIDYNYNKGPLMEISKNELNFHESLYNIILNSCDKNIAEIVLPILNKISKLINKRKSMIIVQEIKLNYY